LLLFLKASLIGGLFYACQKILGKMIMTNSLYRKHIISISELTRDELELIVNTAGQLKATPQPELIRNKVIASCFFEPSTRTRLSFETAIQRIGGNVIGFDNGGNTSLAKKGETLADSVQIISSYVDAFLMRHPQEGAARLASEFSNGVPVINAGDGANQHPTQTLLDLFTITETQGRLDGLNIAFVGDLKYGRTVHSLTQALAKFNNNRFFFIAPDALAMPDYILEELEEAGHEYSLHTDIESVIPQVDILYMTRVQKERFDESEYAHIRSAYILNAAQLQNAKENMKVLHPLPRVDEITTDVDQTPHAYFFQQAENGVYAREALLALVLNETL
jgi:aspartate carbamoyltransferase catalytic subunit